MKRVLQSRIQDQSGLQMSEDVDPKARFATSQKMVDSVKWIVSEMTSTREDESNTALRPLSRRLEEVFEDRGSIQ
jgi:hypothetical protein